MRALLSILLVSAALAGCLRGPLSGNPDEPDATVAFPAIRFETEAGAFTAIVFENETPATAAFMRGLVESGYYDGREFGRTIPGFVIQEVDRTGGTTDQREKVEAEFGTAVMFSAGAIGIARDADPQSGGSEFFVMDFPISSLYGNYTAFAQVVEGMEVVHAIARGPAVRTGPAGGVVASPPGSPVYFGLHDRVPVDPVQMTKVTMTTVEMPASVAARYPLLVGETTRADTYRATLEWPRDLRAGAESELAWYVAPRDATPQGQAQDPAPVDLAGAKVRIDGPAPAESAPVEDADVRGILRWSWTPGQAGSYVVRLLDGAGSELAATNVTVPR